MTLSLVPRLWKAISPRRRGQFRALMGLNLLASLAEVFSIGAVLPFLGVLAAPEKFLAHDLGRLLAGWAGIERAQDLIAPVAALFCAAVLTSAGVRMLATWLRTRLTFAIGSDLGVEIYRRTLLQPYSAHLARHSSEVIDGVSSKVHAVIVNALNPVLVVVSNMIMLAVIMLALLVYEPVLAISTFAGLALIYAGVFLLSRARLRRNSREVARNSTQRVKVLQEGLGGIRDVLLGGMQEVHVEVFRRAEQRMRQAQARIAFSAEAPRFVVEALGMCLLAWLVLHLTHRPEGVQAALPLIGALAVAAQRVLPLLQQVYRGLTSLSGNDQSLRDALALLEQSLPATVTEPGEGPLPFEHAIQCVGLGFRYDDERPWVLRGLGLTIEKGARIGIVGACGATIWMRARDNQDENVAAW